MGELPQVNDRCWEPMKWRRSTNKRVTTGDCTAIALGMDCCFIGTFEFIVVFLSFWTGELEHGPSTLSGEFQYLRGFRKLKPVLAGT